MAKKTTMNVLCAWCGKYLKTIDGKGTSGDSHGICKECFQKQIDELKEKS